MGLTVNLPWVPEAFSRSYYAPLMFLSFARQACRERASGTQGTVNRQMTEILTVNRQKGGFYIVSL